MQMQMQVRLWPILMAFVVITVIGGLGGLIGVLAIHLLGGGQPPRVTPTQQRQAEPAPPVPIIEVRTSPDPNNRAVHFMACARGSPASCISAGAWIIEQAKVGRRPKICLSATGPPEDVEFCAKVTARWPEGVMDNGPNDENTARR